MEFPQDQLIMFKAMDAEGGVVARYGLFDLGSGTVDKITVKDTVDSGVASFIYFYELKVTIRCQELIVHAKAAIVNSGGGGHRGADRARLSGLCGHGGPAPGTGSLDSRDRSRPGDRRGTGFRKL